MGKGRKYRYRVEGEPPKKLSKFLAKVERNCLSLKEAVNVKEGLEAVGYSVQLLKIA